jgi:DNA-3-methyladenine glycosylase
MPAERECVVLPRSFYLRPVLEVAPNLVGKLIVYRGAGGRKILRIVETEAYSQDDPASHSFGGPRGRNTVMFGAGGAAYVYRSYGIHHCLNVVTGPEGRGEAVLIRAGEPIEGLEDMWRNRFPDRPHGPRLLRRLAAGPGNLTRALGITTASHNGVDLVGGELTIRDDGGFRGTVIADQRVGISKATERPWRFLAAGSLFVSRRRRNHGATDRSAADRDNTTAPPT